MPLLVCPSTTVSCSQLISAAEPEVRKKREYKDMEHGEKAQDLHAKVDMSTVSQHPTNCIGTLLIIQIQFTAADLYDKDKVDIEHIVMEDVLTLLQCDEGGLTEAEAVNRIGIFGPNKLEEKSEK
jgi:H+-transporting ATPase